MDAAHRFGQPAKDMDKKQQPLHDHVAEHHVKQQLLVVPACPLRWFAPSVVAFGVGEQAMEFGARPL